MFRGPRLRCRVDDKDFYPQRGGYVPGYVRLDRELVFGYPRDSPEGVQRVGFVRVGGGFWVEEAG